MTTAEAWGQGLHLHPGTGLCPAERKRETERKERVEAPVACHGTDNIIFVNLYHSPTEGSGKPL